MQFVLPLPWLRGTGGRFTLTFDWRNPHVIRVLKLMLPVTIALGLINFSLLINSFIGTLAGEEVPAAIDKAFRIYMLPQGLFSVAIATILFPTLSRLAARGATDELRATMANGLRQILLTADPVGRDHGRAGRADHAARLRARRVRRRGDTSSSPTRCSGGRSRCPRRAPACCCRARSSRSSGRG